VLLFRKIDENIPNWISSRNKFLHPQYTLYRKSVVSDDRQVNKGNHQNYMQLCLIWLELKNKNESMVNHEVTKGHTRQWMVE
jgi:hypothetical protein